MVNHLKKVLIVQLEGVEGWFVRRWLLGVGGMLVSRYIRGEGGHIGIKCFKMHILKKSDLKMILIIRNVS